MPERVALLLLLMTVGVFPRASRADTLVLQASQDTTIYDQQAAKADGEGQDFYVGKTGAMGVPPLRRALIEFDLSAIPAGSTITGATLTLTMTKSGAGSGTADPISIYQVLAAWGEGASTAPEAGGLGALAQANDATWTYRFFNTTQIWTTPGGDFDPVASATKNVSVYGGTPISYNWVGAGLMGDVQEWVNNPSSNSGWIIRGDETKTEAARRFASSEYATVSLRPKLTVNYTVPEPGSAALMLVGGAWLGRRRRWK